MMALMRRNSFVLGLALLCCFAGACGTDESEQANRLVDEMNVLNAKGEVLAKQATEKEEMLGETDASKQGDAVLALAEEQVALYKEAADIYRQASAKAAEASKLKVSSWFKNYLTLKGEMFRKLAEVMDAGREGAEVWVNERNIEVIAEKRDQIGERAQKLSKEVQEMSTQVQKIEEEHKDEFGK